MYKTIAAIIAGLLSLSCMAVASDSIVKISAPVKLETVYQGVYKALEDNRFYVVFEAAIGDRMSNFQERWGDDYNRSQLTGIRSMVVCNIWYVNQVANLDPDMLGLCPLRLTLVEKDGVTRVLFARPTLHAKDSAALPVIQEVEDIIIKAIKQGIKNSQ